MALTKSVQAITELTASGTSGALAIGTSYTDPACYRLYNGTSGTPTTAATAQLQGKANGGTYFYNIGPLISGDLTTSSVITGAVPVPDGFNSLQWVYTAPSGGSVTGYTFDSETPTITGI